MWVKKNKSSAGETYWARLKLLGTRAWTQTHRLRVAGTIATGVAALSLIR